MENSLHCKGNRHGQDVDGVGLIKSSTLMDATSIRIYSENKSQHPELAAQLSQGQFPSQPAIAEPPPMTELAQEVPTTSSPRMKTLSQSPQATQSFATKSPPQPPNPHTYSMFEDDEATQDKDSVAYDTTSRKRARDDSNSDSAFMSKMEKKKTHEKQRRIGLTEAFRELFSILVNIDEETRFATMPSSLQCLTNSGSSEIKRFVSFGERYLFEKSSLSRIEIIRRTIAVIEKFISGKEKSSKQMAELESQVAKKEQVRKYVCSHCFQVVFDGLSLCCLISMRLPSSIFMLVAVQDELVCKGSYVKE